MKNISKGGESIKWVKLNKRFTLANQIKPVKELLSVKWVKIVKTFEASKTSNMA